MRDDYLRGVDDANQVLGVIRVIFCSWFESIPDIMAQYDEGIRAAVSGSLGGQIHRDAAERLGQLHMELTQVISHLAAREGRLADIAVGLADVQLDEERAEGDPSCGD